MEKKYQNKHFSPAERLRILRSIAGFSTRKSFCEAMSIPLPTMESWEKNGGILSPKGATRLVQALQKIGVSCTEEWLLWGIGFFPQNKHALASAYLTFENKNKLINNSDEMIFKEISIFLNQSKNAVVLCVPDHQMYPFYEKGDYVGGLRLFNRDISQALGYNCIIEQEDGSVIVRRLEESLVKDHYSLFCYTPSKHYSFVSACDIPLKSAAPIIWHRKFFTISQQGNHV